jgi:hypothetical protein
MMLANRSMVGNRKHGRSAVSNGTKLLDGVDGRSRVFRRYKDLVRELSAGGEVDAVRQQFIRRIATLAVFCERCEADMTAGRSVNWENYTRSANAMKRLLRDLDPRAQEPAQDALGLLRERLQQRKTEEAATKCARRLKQPQDTPA